MTKALAPTYEQSLLDSSAPDLTTATVKVLALTAGYVYSSAHDFVSDIASGDPPRVVESAALTGKTITNGVFNANDLSLGSPAGGSTITQFWLFVDNGGAESADQLIYYWNEDASSAPISIATDGSEITIVWNASGIFKV